MFQIFTPVPDKEQTAGAGQKDRRRHSRHRLMQEIDICPKSGIQFTAMGFEISESGLSAATSNYLTVGEIIELFPIAGGWVKAIVRRKVGAMYGFEFLYLTQKQTQQIRDLCDKLPLFQSTAGI